jgi:hypothetical protein
MAHAIDRHLPLLHGFEQRGLRARGSAVDFVDEKEVSEYRTAVQRESAVTQIEDVRSGDVGGHEVGRALNALKAETADARQRFHGERFGKAGDAFYYRVASADENKQKLIDDFALADNDLREFTANVRCECGKVLHG